MPARLREIAGSSTPAVGLGCMNLSYGYGNPAPRKVAERVLLTALDLGISHFDTAALYGFGHNEELLGSVLKPQRERIMLASKCGMRGVDGKRVIDGHPDMLRKDIEASLARLQTEVIDLYYLHRWDRKTPIEESIGFLGQLVDEGKIRAIGLSEVSADTLRRAGAVHPIAAVQSEYSLWSRNVEIAVLDACREVGAAFVAFAPLARAFLTSVDLDPATFGEGDLRRGWPRFQPPHFAANCELLPRFRVIARSAGATPAQAALAWVLQQAPHIHVIPGTTSPAHLEEDFGALDLELSATTVQALDELINEETVSGPRYAAATQAEIDTEEFD
ncbi:MAG: aldo/keto reductase [Gammaproteobacteria bacterium]|nr:aldo/keto reductase [Gammaproteobacteria bacterium]MDH4253289.1 aldo/keto reductase [Gammaproteobacteria bacterium]MDH5310236.1 aldo/keto reductase [Gammaproteobacteria bacterium]